jgi:hypothetical protein
MLNTKYTRLLMQNGFSASTLKEEWLAKNVFNAYSESLLGLTPEKAKEELLFIICNPAIWNGYQEYNRIMREQGGDHYCMNREEIQLQKEKLQKVYDYL